MAKKLSEMTVDKPKAKAPAPSTTRGEREVQDITKGMSNQLKLYGKRIPYTELEEIYDFISLNVADLITAVHQYISTYVNPKRAPAKVGGITERRNLRMAKIKEFLINFEKKRE